MIEEPQDEKSQSDLWIAEAKSAFEASNFDEAIRLFHLAAEKESLEAWHALGRMYEGGLGVDQNMDEAIRYYRLSAEHGYHLAWEELEDLATADYVEAQYALGDLHIMESEYQDIKTGISWYYNAAMQRHEKALSALQKMAKEGCAEAQNALGEIYQKGAALTRNNQEAVRLYRLSAEQGYPPAQYNLAWAYFDGLDRLLSNREEAYLLLFKAAQQGYSFAKNDLWEFLKDEDNPAGYLKELANKDSVEAVRTLGDWYATGDIVGQINFDEAVECYYKAAVKENRKALSDLMRVAVEKEHVKAQYYLGHIYYYGEGIAKNNTKAVKWLRMAVDNRQINAKLLIEHLAKKQDADAQCLMGDWYSTGNVIEQINFDGAVECYCKAAMKENRNALNRLVRIAVEQGHAKAQYYLGQIYYYGDGITKDYKEAVKWLRMAAENGEIGAKPIVEHLAAKQDADAQCVVGDWYVTGDVVGQINLDEAVECYYKAVVKENKKALDGLKSAAEKGHVKAQYYLGHIYYYGEGIQKDSKEAVKWLRMAAEKGAVNAKLMVEHLAEKPEMDAQCVVGDWYRIGSVLEKNIKKAIGQYALAAQQGHSTALSNLEDLALRDNPEVYFLLGEFYLVNKSFSDFEKSQKYFEEAVKNKIEIGACYCYLGLLNEYGLIASASREKVFHYYEKAVKINHPMAQLLLGVYYQRGFPNVEQPVDRKKVEGMYVHARKAQKKYKNFNYESMVHFFELMTGSDSPVIRMNAKLVLAIIYEHGLFHLEKIEESDRQRKVRELYREIRSDCDALFKQSDKAHDETLVGYYKMFSKFGDEAIGYRLGCLYRDARGVKKDNKIAFGWFLSAAKARNPEARAQYYMGLLQEKSILGTPIDLKAAAIWYEFAAKQGHAGALYRLSHLLSKKDDARSLKLLSVSAAKGYARALFKLGQMHYFGQTVPQDLNATFQYYTAAALKGHPGAQYKLGKMYQTGEGIGQDFIAASNWYKATIMNPKLSEYSKLETGNEVINLEGKAIGGLSCIAKQGSQNAALILGVLYMTSPNLFHAKEAYKYIREAKESGNRDAYCYLGLLTEYGIGVFTQSIGKALSLYHDTADNPLILLQIMLCCHSMTGRVSLNGGDAFYKMAEKFLQRACELQEASQDKTAGVEIIHFFERQLQSTYSRIDLPEDVKKNLFVNVNLFFAIVYSVGLLGVNKDLKRANEFYAIVKKNGDAITLYHLGCLYEYGLWVEPDPKAAVKCYSLSGQRGLAEACRKMISIYEEGLLGVEQDINCVKGWKKLEEKAGKHLKRNSIELIETFFMVEDKKCIPPQTTLSFDKESEHVTASAQLKEKEKEEEKGKCNVSAYNLYLMSSLQGTSDNPDAGARNHKIYIDESTRECKMQTETGEMWEGILPGEVDLNHLNSRLDDPILKEQVLTYILQHDHTYVSLSVDRQVSSVLPRRYSFHAQPQLSSGEIPVTPSTDLGVTSTPHLGL